MTALPCRTNRPPTLPGAVGLPPEAFAVASENRAPTVAKSIGSVF
jgi:hypothetical protein